jgi:hypothetical protein
MRADGKIAYLFTQSSNAINILQHFIDDHKKPKFLDSPNYLRNIFQNKINTIHKYVNFDAVRSSYNDYNVRYSSETEKDWFARNFKYFFLASTIDEIGKGRYIQQFLTISNKPNIVAAEINFLKWNDVEKSILAILDQQNNRDFTKVKVDNNLNIFDALSPRKENQTDLEYAKQIVEAMKAKGSRLTTVFDLKNNVDLAKLKTAVSTYAENEEDLAALYFANFYVNSHQLNHLVAGDQAFYKGSFDVIKRMSIAFATGYSGLVSSFALPETYRSLVVKDIESVLGEDFVAFQKIWGKKFDLTDAQGYMTPKRAAEVRRGFGNAFKLGSILKPVHFEIDEKGNNIVTELGLDFDPRDEIKKRNNQIGFQEFSTKSLPNELADCLTEKDFLDEIFNLKDRLKDLWLDYFQYHQSWLINYECWVECSSSEETRPIAHLILGVMSVIEPRLKDYLIPLFGLNSSGEEIVKVLNLDFSPETELGKREEERKLAQEATFVETSNIAALDLEYRAVQEGLEEIRTQFKQLENSS